MMTGMTTIADDPTRPAPFPGPWLAGASLVLAPLLILVGTVLRLDVPFFFPHQLAAYQSDPGRMTVAYGAFLAGTIGLWPGVVAVAGRVAASRPGWGAWGGALVMFGLFARAFHYGVNTFAFAAVDSLGTETATRAVASYYARPEWVVSSLTLCVMFGWIVLALGCYLSRVLRLVPALALALMSGLMIGVLKGSTWASVVEVAGLVVALVPLGITFLRTAARPSRRAVLSAVPVVVAFVAASVVLGQLG
jgi:hypothetical protein